MKTKKPIWLTFEGAAEETGIPVWRLRKWAWAKVLPTYSEGPRCRTYIKLGELLDLMESLRNTERDGGDR